MIRQLLDSEEICRDIVQYLVQNEDAADTVSGIAEWWIQRDVDGTARALTELSKHGIVKSHLVQDALYVYTLTASRRLRDALRQCLDESAISTEQA